ncbi:hypothetical protein DCAR_0832578 [Daucus carota subsp. sativus]|uniref:Uncharacterized protein n=1 Tax=Daucus carota subsp. sativus TaxID=79200 RepID=A0A175YRT0_DAUCS|nr:PREDICTED: inactive protein RESTRICTED TEV MOVEMENT 1-like [Daucus carota subsp. sativus]WOH13069.1 hypothetical protein DCAR_0832578 [Daucus carota subsp. sativus]
MLKAGLPWTDGLAWDHKGKCDIAQIIVSRSINCIDFIQFVYVEDEGKKLVVSEKIGNDVPIIFSLNTITLDYPHEVITGSGVKGKCEELSTGDSEGFQKLLRSITFVTNKRSYGPFEVEQTAGSEEFEFEYHVGFKQFGGFFGTYMLYGLETIGIYMKPMEKLLNSTSIKTE